MFRAKNRNAKIAMLLIDRTNRRNSGTPRRKMIAQIWTVVQGAGNTKEDTGRGSANAARSGTVGHGDRKVNQSGQNLHRIHRRRWRHAKDKRNVYACGSAEDRTRVNRPVCVNGEKTRK
jgi:hypothetical protein